MEHNMMTNYFRWILALLALVGTSFGAWQVSLAVPLGSDAFASYTGVIDMSVQTPPAGLQVTFGPPDLPAPTTVSEGTGRIIQATTPESFTSGTTVDFRTGIAEVQAGPEFGFAQATVSAKSNTMNLTNATDHNLSASLSGTFGLTLIAFAAAGETAESEIKFAVTGSNGLSQTFPFMISGPPNAVFAIPDSGPLGTFSTPLIIPPNSTVTTRLEASARAFAMAGVPEPSTLLLVGSGLAGLACTVWRRHRRT